MYAASHISAINFARLGAPGSPGYLSCAGLKPNVLNAATLQLSSLFFARSGLSLLQLRLRLTACLILKITKGIWCAPKLPQLGSRRNKRATSANVEMKTMTGKGVNPRTKEKLKGTSLLRRKA